MPRIPRGLVGGGVAHVLNRGNAKAQVFHSSGDYERFVRLLGEAEARFPIEIYAFCLMPNHFHLVTRVDQTATLSAMMQWWLTSHVRAYHRHHATDGHVWQGRYKSFPIQEDEHLLTVLRYVLRNPVRAGLVGEATEWPWSSLRFPAITSRWPLDPPTDHEAWLATEPSEHREDDVRHSIRRGAPFGDEVWREATAQKWGLESTLTPRGRPKCAANSDTESPQGDLIAAG